MERREFLSMAFSAALPQAAPRPNVVLVLTDDQGFGDLSLHGNPHLRTPHMDSVANDGMQFTQFQVCPVCSPTRSSLLTGRYNYRTGIVDTFLGRSMMYPDEVTIAEVLSGAGYRTGIFGKWHLGDNYPMRAMDQGFQETLVHKGGGIGQASDPPGSSYFDPILFHNGVQKQYKGYCTDVFFDGAMQWIAADKSKPFFAYIPTNAPHSPLQISDSYADPFRAKGLSDETARVYGMVKNIDDNLGRLLAKLKELGKERETIVIFMTDNGAIGEARFDAGLRGTKTTPYQNGIQVPFFLRWPGKVTPGSKVDRIAAHIDVFPTLLAACGVAMPAKLKIDGLSLMPLIEGRSAAWPDRMLFTQWHRGDHPEPFRGSAVRSQRYKLINGVELYDMEADPGEKKDIADSHPDVVKTMRAEYSKWFADVSSTRNYVPPRIYIGTTHENPVVLTRQDWRVPPDARGPAVGWWEVDVKRSGKYKITITLDKTTAAGEGVFELNGAVRSLAVERGATECVFRSVPINAGTGPLRFTLKAGGKEVGAKFVEVLQIGG